MKAFTLSVAPVISNTKDWIVESMTLARKTSARRRLSTRFSPVATTLSSASSRSTCGPPSVMSRTRCTGTRRSSCDLICSITIGVPDVTMVKRERCSLASVSATVRLSML